MEKRKFCRRSLAALLALALTLTLAPAAAAQAVYTYCQTCGELSLESKVLHEANCHEEGVIEYICNNPSCLDYKKSQLVKTAADLNRHDVIYTDNGDGTHSGVCRYHPAYEVKPTAHQFKNGACEQCSALNYGDVEILGLSEQASVPVALGDASAKLSAAGIKLVLGSANITDDYNLQYHWYDYNQGGQEVGTGVEFRLPASVYGKEGVYYYSLVVMATPKTSISRQPLSKTCSFVVKVEELITASAVVASDAKELYFGDGDGWSAGSISSQIYDAVQDLCARDARPSSVSFHSVDTTTVGRLSVTSVNTRYSFGDTIYNLDDVYFVPQGAVGEFTVGFTAYDTKNESYKGVLTISVQEYAGSMDVLYVASRTEPTLLGAAEFENFWEKVCPGGVLEYITFDQLPRSVEGTLTADYVSAAYTGASLRVRDALYVNPVRNQFGIDSAAFIPGVGVRQSDYITLSFTAYGTRSVNRQVERQGVMYLFFNGDGRSADVTVTAATGGTALKPEDFLKAYQSIMDKTAASFYIRLMDVPKSGSLYLGRTANRDGVLLTAANIEGRTFAYSDARGETISGLTYVPGTAASESIRYVAIDAQGQPLFAGNINFTSTGVPAVSNLYVDYRCSSTGVAFKGSDFENLLGANAAKLSSVTFTPPAAAMGTLYYGRTSLSGGVPVSTENLWFNVAAGAGAVSLNDLTFVPAASYTSGLVSIPFTAISAAGNRSTGVVRITVSPSTQPTNPTNPTQPVNPTTPAKTFKDVPKTEWFYTYVTDLTTTGVLNGYEDGTFRPNGAVTLGEALKMIMTSTGYGEQAPTDKHWASGYLAKAKADGLLPSGVIEKLDRPVDRYTIAEIAVRAMKLQTAPATASPFSDMAASHASAPAVMALYNIKVVTGETKNNQVIFNGTYAIKRSEFAAIIWRMRNYTHTGNVNGTLPTVGG